MRLPSNKKRNDCTGTPWRSLYDFLSLPIFVDNLTLKWTSVLSWPTTFNFMYSSPPSHKKTNILDLIIMSAMMKSLAKHDFIFYLPVWLNYFDLYCFPTFLFISLSFFSFVYLILFKQNQKDYSLHWDKLIQRLACVWGIFICIHSRLYCLRG